jgi:hypothetical protein
MIAAAGSTASKTPLANDRPPDPGFHPNPSASIYSRGRIGIPFST